MVAASERYQSSALKVMQNLPRKKVEPFISRRLLQLDTLSNHPCVTTYHVWRHLDVAWLWPQRTPLSIGRTECISERRFGPHGMGSSEHSERSRFLFSDEDVSRSALALN